VREFARLKLFKGSAMIWMDAECGRAGCRCKIGRVLKETMKRVVTVVLVLLLSSALTTPVPAQIFMGPNSQKQAETAAQKEKKTELKNAKKKQKAMRKYEKREQKAERRER